MDVEQAVTQQVTRKFRLFVLMYLVYPGIILGLLGLLGATAYRLWMVDGGYAQNDHPPNQPSWCVTGGQSYGYPSVASYGNDRGAYEPATGPSVGVAPRINVPAIDLAPQKFPGISNGASAGAMDDSDYDAIGDVINSRISRYVEASIGAADGSHIARRDRDSQPLTKSEKSRAGSVFMTLSRDGGWKGRYRLGLARLGDEAYPIALKKNLYVPFCPPNNFLSASVTGNTDVFTAAYVDFEVARQCDASAATDAVRWLDAIAEHQGWDDAQQEKLLVTAGGEFSAGVARAGGIGKYCEGYLAKVADTTSGNANTDVDEDSDLDDEGDRATESAVGPNGAASESREQRRANRARRYLNLGDASLAEGDVDEARRTWLRAIKVGKSVGAQASIVAQKRIQTHTLTCHFTNESLKAISRDYKARSGDLIHMRVIQQALHALGHYDGPINGDLSIVTRAAIRKFQREMAFDETDTLSPVQTVYLLCNAAETARDLASQNALGIMYATGLGVEQNIDISLEWLRAASTRGYADATFNLSILYGSGIILNSYRLCQIPRSLEQADQYLYEAANQKHPFATALVRRYGPQAPHGPFTPADRWRNIEKEQLMPSQGDPTDVYEHRLATLEPKC
ncbi:MAG: hypothetical protein K8S25_17430, partial [Alphaproteobacteria bacterium]|nr:hypothetical protein [Alphaproteobacteria bacterium]